MAAARPLEWTGDAAATIVTGRPPGGGPPAAYTAARAGPSTDAANSAYSSTVWTNRPRSPELPPEARQTYRPSSRPGSRAQAASCCSARARVTRRSVSSSSKLAIICCLVITGSSAS